MYVCEVRPISKHVHVHVIVYIGVYRCTCALFYIDKNEVE